MKARLRRAGVLNRKVLQRLRNFLDTPTSFDIQEVFPAVNTVCKFCHVYLPISSKSFLLLLTCAN